MLTNEVCPLNPYTVNSIYSPAFGTWGTEGTSNVNVNSARLTLQHGKEQTRIQLDMRTQWWPVSLVCSHRHVHMVTVQGGLQWDNSQTIKTATRDSGHRYLVLTKKEWFRSLAGLAIRWNVTIKQVGPDPESTVFWSVSCFRCSCSTWVLYSVWQPSQHCGSPSSTSWRNTWRLTAVISWYVYLACYFCISSPVYAHSTTVLHYREMCIELI